MKKTIYIQLTAGVGPTECAVACEKVLQYFADMYVDTYHFRIVDYEADDVAGYRSVVIEMPDMPEEDAAAMRSKWHGTIRVISTENSIRPNHKRKNWFVGSYVLDACAESEKLDMKDVKIDRFRSSGAGGQHVNVTESAVRLTHIPTGIAVKCEAERSQIRNLETAKKILLAKLAEYNAAEEERRKNGMWINHKSVVRGNEIMTIKAKL